MPLPRILGIGAAVLMLGGVYSISQPASAALPRALSAQEMQQVRGGVSVTRMVAPASGERSGWDNIPVKAELLSAYESGSVAIQTYAGSTKAGFEMVSIRDFKGTYETRSQAWPPGPASNLSMRYCASDGSGCWNAGGDATRSNVGIHPEVKVVKVIVWNLRNGEQSADFDGAEATDVFDSSRRALPFNWPHADTLLVQCAGAKQWQFRFHTMRHADVPAACLKPKLGGTSPVCSDWKTRLDAIVNTVSNPQEFFHVFVAMDLKADVDGDGSHDPIYGVYPRKDAAPVESIERDRNWVLVKDNDYIEQLTPIIVHEWGHSMGLYHSNDASNLMYHTSSPFTGTMLTSSQCDQLYKNVGPGGTTQYRDWNSGA